MKNFLSIAKSAFGAVAAVITGMSATGVAIGGIAIGKGIQMSNVVNPSPEHIEQTQQAFIGGVPTLVGSVCILYFMGLWCKDAYYKKDNKHLSPTMS